MAPGRPFYAEFGWAYDALVAGPVEPWVEAVENALREREVPAPATLLDAGCGTGRHAAALAARGHSLVLLEPEPALLAQARRRLPEAPALGVELRGTPVLDPVDGALCRGVLNDLLEDADRDAALAALAQCVRSGGVLVLDVRDRDDTAARYGPGLSVRTEVDGLTFSAEGRMDGDLVRIHERHEARGRVAEYDFAMRPWTPEEISGRLGRTGWRDIELGPGAGARRGDRRLVVATRG